MQLESYFDFLRPDDIRIKGHRIGIESILYEYLYNEKTAEEIAECFPTLTLEQIYATILYYLRNREEITRYMREWLEHGERMRAEQERHPTPAMMRLRKIRAQRETTHTAVKPTA